jgi:hypothetical protein
VDRVRVARFQGWTALGGAVVTLLMAFHFYSLPGVYGQTVTVVFRWPQLPSSTENALQYGTDSLIKTAGVVATVVGDSKNGAAVTSDTATLIGQGVRHGYSVRLPNYGGQWAYDFRTPVVTVETVGSTPAEVRATMTVVLKRVNDELLLLQRQEGVSSSIMVTTKLSPPSPILTYSMGSRSRAVVITLVLGGGLTTAAVQYLGRRRRRREDEAIAALLASPGTPAPAEAVASADRAPITV